MITPAEIKTILTVPVLFSHQGEPIYPILRIVGVLNGKLFGDIFAEETTSTSDGGGSVTLQQFKIPFGWMRSVWHNEGLLLPSLEETIGNWEIIIARDIVAVVENKTETLAMDSKDEVRPYMGLFANLPKVFMPITKVDLASLEPPIGINPLLKWDKTQEQAQTKVRLARKEKKLIMSFHVRPQKCWICDKFLDAIQKDDEGYYIPVEVFEDDGIVEHLEQILKRKLDL